MNTHELEIKLLTESIDALRKDYDLAESDHGRTAIADLMNEHQRRLGYLKKDMELVEQCPFAIAFVSYTLTSDKRNHYYYGLTEKVRPFVHDTYRSKMKDIWTETISIHFFETEAEMLKRYNNPKWIRIEVE